MVWLEGIGVNNRGYCVGGIMKTVDCLEQANGYKTYNK
jgi:hypothetical protein